MAEEYNCGCTLDEGPKCDHMQKVFLEINKTVFTRIKHDIDPTLGHSHMYMLIYLAHYGELTVTDIANHLGVTLSAVTGLVNKLCSMGLVNRLRDEADRRLVYIQITDEGRKVIDLFNSNCRRVFSDYFSNLTSEEVNTLFQIMEKVFDKIAADINIKKGFKDSEEGMKLKNKLIYLALITALAVLPAAGCQSKAETTTAPQLEETVTAVSVQDAAKTTVESIVTLNSKIKPIKEINVVPKAMGKVSKVNYDIGQRVSQNAVLFSLDTSDIVLQVQSAEAALRTAEINFNRTSGGLLEQQLAQLKSSVANAEVSYNDAKSAYEKTKELYNAGAVSKDTLDKAESAFKLAENNYNFAKTNYELTVSKLNPDSVAAAEAQMLQAKAALDIAKSQLDNAIVKSPISGIVSARNIDEGEMVSTAVAAMTVIDISKVIVDINVTEEIINKMKIGDKVTVNVNSAVAEPLTGTITNISPAADPKTQNYAVRVLIDNKDELLKGGMFAEIKLAIDKAENVLAVPIEAVIDESGKKVVYIVKDNIAYRREVTVGFSSDKLVEIKSGIDEGDAVIIKGQNFIQDGVKVNITEK